MSAGENGDGPPSRRRAGVPRSRASELLELLAADAATPYPTHLADRPEMGTAGGSDDPAAVAAARRIASLLDGYRQRATQSVPLLRTARELLHCPDTESVLDVAVRRARRTLSFDVAFVAWPDRFGRTVRFPAADGVCLLRDQVISHLEGAGLGALALESRSVAWTPDYLDDPAVPHSAAADAIVADEGLRCVAVVPLDQRGQRPGLLFLAQRRVHHISAEELTFVSDLAELVSIALDAHSGSDSVFDADRPGGPLRPSGTVEFADGLFEAALGPDGVHGVLSRAAAVLGGPALLRSVSGTVLARDGKLPAALLDGVGRALPEAVQTREPVALGRSGRLTAVGTADDVLGYLVTAFSPDGADRQSRLLTLVARALATAIVHARAQALPDGDDGLLDALCAARPHAVAHLAELAGERGVPVAGSTVLVARPAEGPAQWVRHWLRCHPPRPEHLLTVRDGDVVLLTAACDAGPAARRLAEHVRGGTGRAVTVGASGPVAAPDGVEAARLAATRCVDALVAVDGPGAAGSLDELGALGVALTGAGDLHAFAERQLGAVTGHDERTSGTLVATLEAYFEANRSLAQAASALYVHPNTVARRLERLGELLGEDWQTPRRALDLQVALLVRRVRGAVTTPGV